MELHSFAGDRFYRSQSGLKFFGFDCLVYNKSHYLNDNCTLVSLRHTKGSCSKSLSIL